MTPPQLVATCWTHAGPSRPVQGVTLSPLDIRERARACARAGFMGIGFTIEDLEAARATIGWAELRKLVDDLGFEHTEVEFLVDWWTTGDRRAASDRMRASLLEAASVLGARHIKIAPDMQFDPAQPPPPPVDQEHWATELRALAQQAQDVGTRVALEVLPMANLADFTEAAELIAATDHPAAGLCVDIWHIERGPSSLADLARIPGEKVFCVELNDAAATPVGDLYYDTMHHRKLLGQGDFDVRGFIDTLRGTGFAGPWGVEIISDELHGRELDDALADVYRTTIAQFA